jgi:hypothetical protein
MLLGLLLGLLLELPLLLLLPGQPLPVTLILLVALVLLLLAALLLLLALPVALSLAQALAALALILQGLVLVASGDGRLVGVMALSGCPLLFAHSLSQLPQDLVRVRRQVVGGAATLPLILGDHLALLLHGPPAAGTPQQETQPGPGP